MPVEKQIAIIYCGVNGLLASVPVDKVKEFEVEYLDRLEMKHKDVLNALKAGTLNEGIENVMRDVVKELSAKYK